MSIGAISAGVDKRRNRLGTNAMSEKSPNPDMAWLILALALKNLEPGQGSWLGLGLAWLGPQALAFALYI